MDESNEFQYFHEYQRLGNMGVVHELTCECGQALVTILRDGKLALLCPVDNSIQVPGEGLRTVIQKFVDIYRETHG